MRPLPLSSQFLLTALVFAIGCGKSSTAPPIGLVKPPPADFAAAKAEIFEVYEAGITVALPKDNPSKSMLKGTKEDANILLPRLKCQLACRIGPESLASQSFSYTITILAPCRGHDRMAHAMGNGTLKKLENGSFMADVELRQILPLEKTDKATLLLTIGGSRPMASVNYEKGSIVIKQEE